MAQRRTFRKRHQGARTGTLRNEARRSGASGCGGFPCRSEGRDRCEVPQTSQSVLELGIYVKAEVQGMLFLGADFLSTASNSRPAWIQISPRRKHITPPE